MGPTCIGDFLEKFVSTFGKKTPLEFPMFSGLSRLDGPTYKICGDFGGAKVDIEPMKNKPWLCMVFLVFSRFFLVLIFDGVWQLLAD